MHTCSGVPRKRAGSSLALLVTLLALAGCGGSSSDSIASSSSAQILAASIAAAQGANSVSIVSESSFGRLPLTAELQLASGGGRAKLSFLGLDYEILRIGSTVYLKGNPAFYRRLFHRRVHVPAGAWLAGSASGGLSGYARLTDLGSRLRLLLRATGPLSKGGVTTVEGHPVVEVKSEAKLFSGSLYIATTGKPYPLKIVKHGHETGSTTFSGWNQPVLLRAPASTIPFDELMHARS
jgi:hypothetical protein